MTDFNPMQGIVTKGTTKHYQTVPCLDCGNPVEAVVESPDEEDVYCICGPCWDDREARARADKIEELLAKRRAVLEAMPIAKLVNLEE